MNLKNRSRQLSNLKLFYPLLLLVCIAGSPAANAENSLDDATKIINEMSRASKMLNYDGIFIYRRGTRIDTIRIIHKADENGERERLVSLTGHAREVIRNRDTVTCIFPDNQAVMVGKNRPDKILTTQVLPERIESISPYYNFTIAGKDRVADRSTYVVNIVPKDKYRYGYQLWIDEASKLLLKSELKDIHGKPLEQLLFTQIEVMSSIPDHLLEPAISGNGFTWHRNNEADATIQNGNMNWQVQKMPRGFKKTDQGKQVDVTGKMPVVQLVYTDGLAVVSVFVEKMRDEREIIRGASSMGAVNAYAILHDGYQVTAVGEVPQKTVQLMATSASRLN